MNDVASDVALERWGVVTVNIGDYDSVNPAPTAGSAVDWVYITDRDRTAKEAQTLGWRTVLMAPSGSSAFLRSRYPKMRPDEFTPRPNSVYVDARYVVESDAVVAALASHLIGDRWLGLFHHDDRSSIYDEADECHRLGIGSPQMQSQIAHYRALGIEHPTGLWCGGILVRRHCQAQVAFGQAWFDELVRWPTRDQLSLPVAMQRGHVTPVILPGSAYSWPGLRPMPHLVRRQGRGNADTVSARVRRILRRTP